MPPEPQTPTLSDSVFRLAVAIARLEPGPLAKLRRMRPDDPGTAEFWSLALEHGIRTDGPGQRFVALLALLTPRGEPGGKRLHDGGIPFGKAIAASGYPETRLLRFLATPFEMRAEGLEAMVRWLAAKGHDGVNCVDLAALLWFDDTERKLEHERRLARSYFSEIKTRSEKKDQAA